MILLIQLMTGNLLTCFSIFGCPQIITPRKLILKLLTFLPRSHFDPMHFQSRAKGAPKNMEKLEEVAEGLW